MNKCGECSQFIGGGDWNLCCMLRYELCYEHTEACENFVPRVCPLCDTRGYVLLNKQSATALLHGRSVRYERKSYVCAFCGQEFVPAWMMDENLTRIRCAYEKEVSDNG